MRFFFFIIVIAILFSSCFSRFVTTNKELREYYRDKPVKPVYFTIQNDSVKLFCATTGADTLPPLLFIHGAPGAWYGSRVFLDDSVLQKHFQVIAVDRPGYNKSMFKGKRKAVTSIETQAIAIHEALRLNKSTHKGTVVGSSYGGPIAAKLVILYPGSFDHLVMLAAAIDPDKEKFWWFNKWVHHGPLRWLMPRFINHATDEKYSHVKELRKLLPEWQNISVPVTVVQGGADKIVNPVNFDFAKAQLKNKEADFIFLPATGHLIRLQRPDVVKNILLKSFDLQNIHSLQ
jgi:pimeloyl-ACP methyl ester carboxylesterase